MLDGVSVRLWLWWGALCFSAGAGPPPEARPPCPCRCSSPPPRANCSDGRFSAVPPGLPGDTQVLNLTRNRIRALARRQFFALGGLRDLDLSDNEVASVEAEAFLGLRELATLNLARNRLKILPAGAFGGLGGLRSLDISHNHILVLLDSTFLDLGALRRLDASGNELVFVGPRAFAGLGALQELRLDACNLTAVPTEALRPLAALRLFLFRCLALADLPGYSLRPLERLKELALSDSPSLESLSGNSLFGLNLTSLAVRRSRLGAVPYGALRHLVYLVTLDLSYNPIACVRGGLLDLPRLRELRLVGGSLLAVEAGAFGGAARLALLNVSQNRLTTLEAAAFRSADALEALGLDGNPLACDCRLLWVLRRGGRRLDFGGSLPTCSASSRMEEGSFLELPEAEALLVCRRPRILGPGAQEARVDQGHTVAIHCDAEGDPPPAIAWLDPQLNPLSPNGRIRALPNGTLEVRYAQPRDSGAYVCVASNAAGNSSLAASLRVRALPPSRSALPGARVAFPSPPAPGGNGTQGILPDVRTLLVATTIGVASFFSSVSVCFVFMLLWSKGKGQLKHTATIAYVPRSAASSGKGGGGGYTETSRYTMKLI